MARENKRKRDERRFGKAERLADLLQCIPWLISSHEPETLPDTFSEFVRAAHVIDAQNVADYVGSHVDKDWRWTELPPCRLPFPLVFIETRTAYPWSEAFARTGVIMSDVEPGEAIEKVAMAMKIIDPTHTKMASDIEMIREKAAFAIEFGMVALLVGKQYADRHRIVHINRGSLFLGADGVPLRSPFGQVDPTIFKKDDAGAAKHFFWSAMFPTVLTLGFMHCKNVAVAPVEPDRDLNRERKKAGLKPFLRYHTINIEPMKKVLRTEGQVEVNGLKKALHIVRGHFTHYSEERPLFGRPGLHGTFWVPSHARGSLDQGVVISDYNVKAPANP
jgi:hypothetical protein